MNIKVQCNKEKGSRENNIKPKITTDVLLKRKTERTWRKNLYVTFQAGIDPLLNKLEFKDNQRNPLSLIYPKYLRSPQLQLLTNYSESCSH